MLKVGDTVKWRGCFGHNLPMSAKIISMHITEHPRSKYGVKVSEVDESIVLENRVIFDLDNGTWCYSEQIEIGK